MNQPQATRKRLRRTSDDSSSEPVESILTAADFDENGMRRRRRRRLGTEDDDLPPRAKPPQLVHIPNPIPEQRAHLEALAFEMAVQTVQKFFDKCVSDPIRSTLSIEQIERQQTELSASIAEVLETQLEWALNQAWLDARSSN